MKHEIIWSDGVENALNDIHLNSLAICEYHTENYTRIKSYQKYFRVPIIILSGLNSVFSVGLQPFISQKFISLLCCAISLLCGIMSSLELFIGIQPRMEKELMSSKEFYILACDIFKVLSIERNYRAIDGNLYLDAIHNKYCSLIEQSDIIDNNNQKYKLHIITLNLKNNTNLITDENDVKSINVINNTNRKAITSKFVSSISTRMNIRNKMYENSFDVSNNNCENENVNNNNNDNDSV